MRTHPGAAFLVVAALLPAAAGAQPLVVYDDALRNGFEDWSWCAHSLAATAEVHAGSAAISAELDTWQGLYFHRTPALAAGGYGSLTLFARAVTGSVRVRVVALRNGAELGSNTLTVPDTWSPLSVPLSGLGAAAAEWDGFYLQDDTGADQPTFLVDDMVLEPAGGSSSVGLSTSSSAAAGSGGADVIVVVDRTADRRVVDPHIFGVNGGSAAQQARMRWPVRRWGGNSTSRYNWQLDTHNTWLDWFFMNVPDDAADPGALPAGSSADRFIDETLAAGGDVLLTVPTIGWVPKARQKAWGFSQARYGAQQDDECRASGNASWCMDDAGNGVLASGANVTGNDPADTSMAVGPSFVTAWLQHISARVGTAAAGGVRFLALDNEPALWNSTHRDVHPEPLTYAELWQRTVDYATAIKAQDPAARILGPAEWGWCGFLYSAADGCAPGADAAAHGNVPILEWYVQQACAHQQQTGTLPVDYLDVHFYPQQAGVALSTDESPATRALRLRSLRGLWDPMYVDESWIGQPVRLVPRMREWLAAHCPAMKLAVTEYNIGDGDGASAVLAQAEALAIFAREGVDLATRWVAPDEDSAMEDAFRLYLDYDGNGAAVTGSSVRATSSAAADLGAYAVEGDDGTLRVLLFNHTEGALEVAVDPGGAVTGASAFGLEAPARLARGADPAVAGGRVRARVPALAARLVVIPRGPVSGSSSGAASTPASSSTAGDGSRCGCRSAGAGPGVSLLALVFLAAWRRGGHRFRG